MELRDDTYIVLQHPQVIGYSRAIHTVGKIELIPYTPRKFYIESFEMLIIIPFIFIQTQCLQLEMVIFATVDTVTEN